MARNSKKRFKRGDLVITIKPYVSRPKMSHEVTIPAGHVMTVDKTYLHDRFVNKIFIMCKSDLCTMWNIPIEDEYLELATPMMRLLYG